MLAARSCLLAFAVALAACDSGNPPDILGLEDQVAVVGQELTVELMGVDPDGDNLRYTYSSDVEAGGRAMITKMPSGNGLFRWTPIASDVGMHTFDFTVDDGSNQTTVSITIDVRSSGGNMPVFIEPLSTGRVVDLSTTPCIMVNIVVDDGDSSDLTIMEEAPGIEGAMFEQTDGTHATWSWCPTSAQAADADRYTLTLSATDDDGHKTIKNYILVINGSSGMSQRLVINEVDYDNTNTDLYEYVEIFNPSNADVALEGLWLVFVNGATSSEYNAVYLGEIETLPPQGFLLVAGAGVDVPAGTLKIDPGWTQDHIENGEPDGIAIIDAVTVEVLDALSYEGSITAASIIGFPSPENLVEGTALPVTVADSNTQILTLCRFPNGTDTDNAANDWKTCATRTKASSNIQ